MYDLSEKQKEQRFNFLIKHFNKCTGYNLNSFSEKDILYNGGKNKEYSDYILIKSINKGFSCPITFHPDCVGYGVTIKCNICDEKLDITDYDTW